MVLTVLFPEIRIVFLTRHSLSVVCTFLATDTVIFRINLGWIGAAALGVFRFHRHLWNMTTGSLVLDYNMEAWVSELWSYRSEELKKGTTQNHDEGCTTVKLWERLHTASYITKKGLYWAGYGVCALFTLHYVKHMTTAMIFSRT